MFFPENDWYKKLESELRKPYYNDLKKFVEKEYATKTCYPEVNHIYKAFELCSFQNTSVIILGQDPYHGYGQANGLAFSVNKGQKIPPSLRNIYKELHTDLGILPCTHGDLSLWAEQGVLLLNTTLTVEEAKPTSHQKKGWEEFTDSVIKTLSEQKKNCVFVLWGAHAQSKMSLIDHDDHLILESVHPSPLSASRGFFGSQPFSKVNKYLLKHYKKAINWQLKSEGLF